MKRLALAVVVGVILFASCARKGPEEVVKKFYVHLCKMEYDKVQDLVLPEHYHYYGWMSKWYNTLSAAEKEKTAKTEVAVSNIVCTIFNDTEAVCSCLVKVDDKEVKKEELILKKVGKVWLVDKGEPESSMDEEIPTIDINVDAEDPTETDEEIIIE
jgi:hypothetical protein